MGRHQLVSFIDALQSVNLSDIEAEPQITTLDNQPAELLVGELTPIRTIEAGVGGAGEGTFPVAQVDQQETGIILRVTPHVTATGRILLEVEAERSAAELAESDAGFIFRTQRAQTRVLLADGETHVIAGLTQRERTEARSGIPLLMDLPLIGRLFRVTREQEFQRDLIILVAGSTVLLPSGGTILDAVVDTLRRNLLLSNLDRDRIEVFRLQDEEFLTSIQVGSEPWGLTLNACAPLSPAAGCGDTLIVGNSGGTNLSMVYLGPDDGLGPAAEDASRRFLTPDVILFDVERVIDETGVIRFTVSVLPDPDGVSFSDRPQYIARDSTGRSLYSTKVVPTLQQVGTIRKAFQPTGGIQPEVVIFVEHARLNDNEDFTALAHVDNIVVSNAGGDDQVTITDHVPGDITMPITSITDALDLAIADLIANTTSDVYAVTGSRWNIENVGFTDTTFVAASGDGGWVVFGEGAIDPIGRVIMYETATDAISRFIEVTDLITNAGETVNGIGLNYDGTLGVVRGTNQVSFFTTDLRLQGGPREQQQGGSGAVLHPLHANARSLTNSSGEYRPDTHLAFVGSGVHTIDVYDTFHFNRTGSIFIRDVISGPLRASLPFPEDNQEPSGTPFQCAATTVTDQTGRVIGSATEIFQGGDLNSPWPADGGAGGSEDRCVVLKLYGTTDVGGVVVIDVRKSDILRDHASRN